jgi:hypothetical protein
MKKITDNNHHENIREEIEESFRTREGEMI